MRPEIIFVPALLIVGYLIPIIVGFTWIRGDADRSGQPGLLWAVLSIPFGWVSVLVYLALRAVRTPSTPG